MNIPLSRPDIGELERRYVEEVLLTPTLSLGPKLVAFEAQLAEWAGVKHAVAVNSGTSALHLAVRGLGLGSGDEIIMSPFSFVASANCALFEGACPVFVDIDEDTLNLDPGQVEAAITPRTRAILAVDVFGQPADWDALRSIAARRHLMLIEDSAEAIGAEYKGKRAGGFGDAGIFSFYPNKQMTTGEGGAVLTDDEGLATLCRSMRNQGRGDDGGWLQHVRLGYNYRISEINCALGLAQIERLPQLLEARARVAQTYNGRLQSVAEVTVPFIAPYVKMSWFVYVVRLSKEFAGSQRDDLVRALRALGIGCGIYFPPIHLSSFYRDTFGFQPGAFPVAESVGSRTIALPFHSQLSEEEVDAVVSTLREQIAGLRTDARVA